MISDKRLNELQEPLLRLMADIEDQLIRSIISRIGFDDDIKPSDALQWQLLKLRGFGRLTQKNARIIARTTGKGIKEIEKIFETVGYESVEDDEEIFKRAIEKGLLDQIDTTVRNDANLIPILEASIANAEDAFNLTNTIALESANQAYLDIVNRVYLEVNTGLRSYQAAVRSAVIRLADKGITGQRYQGARGIINYPLDAAIRRQIITSTVQTAGKMQLARNESYGNNLVEVSSHLGARPSHAEWQGKIYAVNGVELPYRNLAEATGYGTVGGLHGANCRHQFYPFVRGLSKKRYKPYPVKENNRIYKESQTQRKLENSVRKIKRRLIALDELGDKQTFEAQSVKLKAKEAQLREFKQQTGRKQTSRVNVVGFNRSISRKAVAANRRAAKKKV